MYGFAHLSKRLQPRRPPQVHPRHLRELRSLPLLLLLPDLNVQGSGLRV